MTEGEITILNQILIISMHIASLVKRPCYLFSYHPETKIWACLGQITPSKFDEICPLAIPKQICLRSIHIASLVKIPCYLLKLSSGNEIMGKSQADNSVKSRRNLPISNFIPYLLNVNIYSKFG